MVLIWNGRGVFTFLIFLVMLVAGVAIAVIFFADMWELSDNQGAALSAAIGAALSAIAVYPLDRFVMKQPPDKTMPDPQSGAIILLKNRDSLFWIETRYWTFIFAGLAPALAALSYIL